MKNELAVLVLAWASINIATAGPSNDPLEYKVATVEAGKYISPNDTSVARIKKLLADVQRVYNVPQEKAAEFAFRIKDAAGKGEIQVPIVDVLDFALIACDTKCTFDEYKENIIQYGELRIAPHHPTHQEATHGLLILNYVAKTAMAKRGKK